MATPVIEYSELGVVATSVTSASFTARTVTAGRALAIAMTKTNTNTRTFSTADNQGNTWNGGHIETASGRNAYVDYALNCAGASTTVTITVGGGLSSTFVMSLYEISGATAEDVAPTGWTDTTGADKTYESFNPAVTVADESIVIMAGGHNANAGTLSMSSGVTQYQDGNLQIHGTHIYPTSTGSVSETWTSVGGPRQHHVAAMSLKGAGGGGGGTGFKGLTLLGVG